jgi:hypothetical protein
MRKATEEWLNKVFGSMSNPQKSNPLCVVMRQRGFHISKYTNHTHYIEVISSEMVKRAERLSGVILADGTRADCITEDHAITFRFGVEWAEVIGWRHESIVLIPQHLNTKAVRQPQRR